MDVFIEKVKIVIFDSGDNIFNLSGQFLYKFLGGPDAHRRIRGTIDMEVLGPSGRHIETFHASGESAERASKESQRLDADVELALHGNEDELARFALRQLLPLRRAHEALVERQGEIAREHARCAETLGRQTQIFEGLRERVRARLAAREAEWPEGPASGSGVAEEEIEIELLRRRRSHSAEASTEHPADRARTHGGRGAGEEA